MKSKVATKAQDLLFRFLARLVRLVMGGKTGRATRLLKACEETQGKFITYHVRPVKSSDIDVYQDAVDGENKLAVVLQGPILRHRDFTLETVRLYRKHFSNATIIVSTWAGEDAGVLKGIESLGAAVLLNEPPAYAGVKNINLQIVSSYNGMVRAKELGAEYAIKTRADQRMYAPDIGPFLRNIIEVFPLGNVGPLQQKRIVGMSLNTFKFRMYGLSDMFAYGQIDDMMTYWGPDLDMRRFSDEEMRSYNTPRKWAQGRFCEVYLMTEYLKNIGYEFKWTLQDSWRAFARHFCVIDKGEVDLFWPKYNRLEYPSRTYEKARNSFQEMEFRDWLNIYVNLANISVPELIMDR